MKDLLLTLSRCALFPLSILALSCGGGVEKPPPKDPPQATLSVPRPNTAGQKLTVQVSATGCDQIQSLSIYDRDDFLKSVPYSGPGIVPVDLAINEIKYTRGIAANLSLRARVVCTDGRQNDSQPQAAIFFPAAEVIEAASGTQLVPDNFVTEGALPFINFLGCGNAEGGIPKLFKVDKNGTGTDVRMPFICTTGTVITPKHPLTGKRWVWTPNAGAMAVDSNLAITARVSIPLDLLSVGTDGDAVIYDLGSGGSPSQVARINHQTGGIKWSTAPYGFLIASPVPRNDDVLIASITASGAPSGRANIVVTRVDYGRLNPATGGVELSNFLIKQVASDGIAPSTAPPVAFNTDGTRLYMAFTGLGGITEVFSCATQTNGCDGAAQRWTNPPALTSPIVALVPYAAGSRIAAIAAQKVWILEESTGAVTNKGGIDAPIIPTGGLVVNQIQTGAPPYPHAFYLLAGPPAQESLPAPQPVEIIATEDPTKGELYRYQVNAGSLSVAMDDSGTLWMRQIGDLVRPLSPGEYRQVKPITP